MLWRRPAAQSFSSLQELHLVGETAAQLQVGALVLGTPEAIGLRSKLQQVLLVCPNVAGFHSPLLLRRFIPQKLHKEPKTTRGEKVPLPLLYRRAVR